MSMALSMEGKNVEHFNANIGLFQVMVVFSDQNA